MITIIKFKPIPPDAYSLEDLIQDWISGEDVQEVLEKALEKGLTNLADDLYCVRNPLPGKHKLHSEYVMLVG